MDKDKVNKTLRLAVSETNRKYPLFQGVVIFGSFVTEKPDPSDVDLISVLETYGGSWTFETDDEGEYDDDYYEFYKPMEEFFGAFFLDLARGCDAIIKTAQKRKALLHIESLVALDDPPKFRERLQIYPAKPENFVGIEKAARVILDFYRSS